MKIKLIFHYISYLQYPLMLIAVFFVFKPYFFGFTGLTTEETDLIFKYWNNTLIFMGLGISFSTLQDTKKTQNKLSKNIWENPKKGKITILLFSIMTLLILIIGLMSYFGTTSDKLKELSIGLIVLSIGLIGLLKTTIEMFENHRKDKNTAANRVGSSTQN